jgi:hypothetical protein
VYGVAPPLILVVALPLFNPQVALVGVLFIVMVGQAEHGATVANPYIVTIVPALSTTRIESFPAGGVTVVPVAN